MASVSDVVDIILPVTPKGIVKNVDDLPDGLRTPSILNPLSPSDVIARMDKYGISQSIIPARKYGQEWGVPYEALRDFVAEYPTRLFATAGICPLSKMDGVRRFEEAVRDYGFVGAHGYSSWSGVPIDDRLYYPYYAKAEELGVPFQIEVMGGKTRESFGRPQYLDRVAADFPDLKLVATHTGYPWERDLVGMAEFRSNVYIGYDTLMPSLWAKELIDFANDDGYAGFMFGRAQSLNRIRTSDRILFGTNYLSMDIETVFDEVDSLPFSDEVKAKLYTHNARRLYDLPVPS